jgi:hypothetical protein
VTWTPSSLQPWRPHGSAIRRTEQHQQRTMDPGRAVTSGLMSGSSLYDTVLLLISYRRFPAAAP